MNETQFSPFAVKMRKENLSETAIAAFGHSYMELVRGSSGTISEDSISGISELNYLDRDISGKVVPNRELLQETVVLKLNGGLGE